MTRPENENDRQADRVLKEALFALLKLGQTGRQYGGVLADKEGGMAYISFEIRPKVQDPVVPDMPTPKGYGPLIKTTGVRPEGIADDDVVARHLPRGLSEREAQWVSVWSHDFRLRENHIFYTTNSTDL